ncbi:MAG: ComEC/Rec2 family competence protein [Bacteriovorax sp.]|nr:ComEC/Rec2 family competence protein [Bacteriovorax sp.]
MKFFAFITLISAFLLFFSKAYVPSTPSQKLELPSFEKIQERDFKSTFKNSQCANISWAMMTGEKFGISPSVKKDFKQLELSFFFSPSGMHLTAFLLILFFILKKIKNKKLSKSLRIITLCLTFMLPYLAIKRIVIFRLLIMLQRIFKKEYPVEIIFLLTFGISLLLGHFQVSPFSFILSFLYMGTFISLRDYSRFFMILGLFSSHLLIAFFSGSEVSFISLLINLPIIAIFTLILPCLFLYLFTFKFWCFNWIENLIEIFTVVIHWSAKIVQGTFLSSSFFLLIAIWIILLKKKKRYLLVALLLHGNIANSPAIFHSL